MPVDASIYSNIQAPKVNIPSPLENAQQAMSLSQLGMQQQQVQREMMTRQAVQQAYSRNTDPSGSVNQQGFLSDLGKQGFGQAAMEYGQQFSKANKEAADAQTAKVQAAHQTLSTVVPVLDDFMKNVPEDQKATVWPNYVKQLDSMGIPTQNLPTQYDRGLVNSVYTTAVNTKEHLDNVLAQANIGKTQSETAKNYAEVALTPVKRNAELYGSRSPNAELTSQYDKQADPVRKSQMAMNQMIDNYNNPSPQGDASLVLNAFKIKFPTAPDVNSLEELSKAQGLSDQWKNTIHKALSGGLDKGTRDNLMRDGVSTYRANVDSLHGVQDRYKARQRVQNVDDPTLTAEPAIDNTYSAAMDLQKKIGPYVPPTDRGGILSGVSRLASRVMGSGGGQSANAAEGTIAMRSPNGKIKMVPLSQKAEAIAAGGSVVK